MSGMLLTTKQVAELLNVCTVTVRKLDIPRIEISEKKFRYRPQDVAEYLRQRRTQPNGIERN